MAFVKGKSIADSIALAQEIFCDLDMKVKGSNLILKFDLEKAYGCVSWPFLTAVLQKFSFSQAWISIAEQCWSTPWFSVLFNGESSSFFKAERGLHHGDPLSSNLFILVMEVLS
ncbi:uncharacterized protein LOC131254128 [Magnolia sinica]|uniref:uncharacterized protein LOC131254128 n=1 Tax=Magnolia sinica TaxID=86752 RepID=UPI00265B4330|nr:uncharacterized protein LOC131254128 [Magnolia sinica]